MEQAGFLPETEPVYFRFGEEKDIPRLLELAEQFFNESEMSEFSTFSAENIERTIRNFFAHPDFVFLVFLPDGEEIHGFSAFMMEASYTEELVALGWLFYVTPEYRKTPAGRSLLALSVDYAEQAGCCAFYNGVMAGIDGVAKTMPNMYMKQGFEPLWWGRRVLK